MFDNSVAGINSAFSSQASSARRLAGLAERTQSGGKDLAGETVNQITNQHAVSANTASIKVRDQMLGEIVDLQA